MRMFVNRKRWDACARAGGAARRTIILFALVLSCGMALRSPVSHAQDGGTQPGQQGRESYEIVVESDDNLDRICLGRRLFYPVVVRRTMAVGDAPDAGQARILAMTIEASSSNAAVLTADLVPSRDTPFQSRLEMHATSVGRSTVTVTAVIAAQDQAVTRTLSLQFRVIPCTLKLQLSGVWNTTVSKGSAVIIVAVPDARLTFPTNMLPIHTNVSVTWDTLANRIGGCEGPDHQHFPDFSDTVVQLEADSLAIDMSFYPQSATTVFLCNRPFVTGIDCKKLPDHTCSTDLNPKDMWQIQRLKVELPLEGGSKPVDLTITHDGGTATTKAIITVTPITVEPAP